MYAKSLKIFFITGAYLHHSCWDEWILFFTKKGYECLAPNWPQKNGSIESLWQRHPDHLLAATTLEDIVDYYTKHISNEQNTTRPILVGHSMGGLIVQILLQNGLGSAGIVIQSIPPLGVFSLDLAFLRSNLGPLGLTSSQRKPYVMSFGLWQYSFTNGMTEQLQRSLYKNYLTAESRILIRGTYSGSAKVNFNKKHSPLLLIAGSNDHMAPASLNYNNYKKYLKNTSLTEYKEFSCRSHFSLMQKGWEEIADYIFNWITSL